jgi:hypothetical protein
MGGVALFGFMEDRTPPAVHFVISQQTHRTCDRSGHAFVSVTDGGDVIGAACRRVRVALPLVRGDGSSAAFMVAAEREGSVWAMRVDVSILWLPSQPEGRVTAHLAWQGVGPLSYAIRR